MIPFLFNKMSEYVSRQEYEELRGRITLLEGGNNDVLATKDDLKNLNLDEFKDSLTQLIDANNESEYVSKTTFNKLINYLTTWIRAGNLSMRDLPEKLNE